MESLITFISKFEGTIGTLLGVIITFIFTQLTKKIGKIEFYFNEYEYKYWRIYEGRIENLENEFIEKAENYDYKFRIELYNSSESIKILRDLKIGIKTGDKMIYGSVINSDLNEYNEFRKTTHELNVINIPPKQIISFNLEGTVEKQKGVDLAQINQILFIAKDYKNKTYTKLIKKIKSILRSAFYYGGNSMLNILITLIISETLIVLWKYVLDKIYFKKYLEDKYTKRIKFRDIK